MTSIENLNKTLGNILLIWSISCIIVGIALYFFSFDPLLQGIGFEAMLWGLINLVIAYKLLKRKEHVLEKIRRELSISLGLDLIYPIIGLPLIFLGQDAYLVGNGYGIIIQGAFLLVLDLSYHRRFKQLA
ncbi:MAG: hypothetical protein AM326_10200 [Candidatus Thorarchaeota archaeon SMTZ-45]|nr:MAG: hypothetical protein AM325_02965 [Candidatus Thorarchaeota archaeon SMTZ1-45]KXH74031.1 MAG: hypothetical protein AM326_10200 [Candidatus Thorarchaeota archaeon SMTZ-45]